MLPAELVRVMSTGHKRSQINNFFTLHILSYKSLP